MRRGIGGVLILLALVLWSVTAAAAHPGRAPEAAEPDVVRAAVADASETLSALAVRGLPWAAAVWTLVGLTALALAVRRAPRRTGSLLLGLLLALLAFDTGVHAVHHLDDPDARCAVASASVHVPGAEAVPVDAALAVLLATGTPPIAESPVLPIRFIRPDEGRAPPA
jgi:hypothetical protein